MEFWLTASNVLMLIAFAVPGYLLIKLKAAEERSIAAFAKVLVYVNSPALVIYSFQKAPYSLELLREAGIVLGLSLLFQILMLALTYLVLVRFKKKKEAATLPSFDTDGALALFEQTSSFKGSDAAKNRVLAAASAFANAGFLGVPLVEALMPGQPKAVLFSAVYLIAMNLLCWTLGLFLITGDKKFMSFKKTLINQPTLTLVVALPLFFLGVKLPGVLNTGVELLSKMTAPMCMLILGMRFATIKPRALFLDKDLYISAALKLIVHPMLCFLIMYFMPIDPVIKASVFIFSAMPSANIVLGLAEIHGAGERAAANAILLSTLLSALTVPLLLLLL
ncbi:MAG: AEC family transporter [Christensenellales bacterium]|jgi:predicted permease